MTKKKSSKRRPPKKKKNTLPAPPQNPSSSRSSRAKLPGIEADVISGLLHMHPRGFGFVTPDNPSAYSQDIFIPRHLTDGAVHGDYVEVEVDSRSLKSDKGPEGRILAILKRGRTHLAGTLHQLDSAGNFLAHVPLLGISKTVVVKINSQEQNKLVLKIGDRIIMKVLDWGEERSPTMCEVSHVIGHITDASCDIRAAIEEFDLTSQFSKTAIAEAKKKGNEVAKADLKGRTDLTKTTSLTIDPDTAKDFDDALSLSKDKKGTYHLAVHIADVAAYVPQGSALDKEAYLRCNSVYFPGTCVPMLPEELSNNLCSLRPDVVRLTVSALMDFDKEGNLIGHSIVRSYIKSAKRFTYQEAKEVIDGKKKSPHAATLKLMVELCLLLKKKRFARGSVDFSLPEMVLKIDDKGEPQGVHWVEYDISHQLVEEFMLKANEVVAKHLADTGKPLLYRIHEEPDADTMEDFYAMARSLGFALKAQPAHKDIQHLFEQAKQTPFAAQLFIGFIRSMKLAYYSSENVGHYGLALEHYCHFTSPIRRYTDLIIGRLLFNEEGKDVDMPNIALKCSEQERISFRAESSVKALKKLRLLSRYFRENPHKVYRACVTRIKPFGLSFEVSELTLEGFLHISELENDYFVFDGKRNVLVGRSSGKVHSVGEIMEVMVVSVDLILLESRWQLLNGRRLKTVKT